MKQAKQIMTAIADIPERTLIFASEFFQERLSDNQLSEENFYKVLERLVAKKELVRMSKGIYSRPQKTRFGFLTPSEQDIAFFFTESNSGMLVGYHLYNQLQLTTQISKTYHILTNNAHCKSTINNILLKECDLIFTDDVKRHLAMLEVLSSVDVIQDLNEKRFIEYCEEFAIYNYDDQILNEILTKVKYKKRTINFLKLILDAYSVPHTLENHLSRLSKYKEPRVKYYEAS